MGSAEQEQYMIDALKAIRDYGKDGGVVLRPYMDKRGIKWHEDEDVKTWMKRIAEDALEHGA